MDLTKLVIVALIAESLWETAKLIWQHGKINIDRIGAILVGILLAIITGLDMFEMLGLKLSIPILGEIITGLLLSRGANFMHDLLGSVGNMYSRSKSS